MSPESDDSGSHPSGRCRTRSRRDGPGWPMRTGVLSRSGPKGPWYKETKTEIQSPTKRIVGHNRRE